MIHYLGTCIAVGIGLGWVVEQGAGEHKKEDRVACGKFPGTKKSLQSCCDVFKRVCAVSWSTTRSNPLDVQVNFAKRPRRTYRSLHSNISIRTLSVLIG
jgi:hypothetical protein